MSWVRIPSPAPGARLRSFTNTSGLPATLDFSVFIIDLVQPLGAVEDPFARIIAELGDGSLIAEPTGSLTLDYQVPAGAALGNYGLQVFMSDKRRATSTDFVVVEDIFDVFTVVARPLTEELAGFGGRLP